jgi:hypothetical protein
VKDIKKLATECVKDIESQKDFQKTEDEEDVEDKNFLRIIASIQILKNLYLFPILWNGKKL